MQLKISGSMILTTISLLLASCAGYWHFTKASLPHQSAHYPMAAKTLSPSQAVATFGRDVVKAGYQPIEITITNHTDHYLSLNPKNLTINTVPATHAAKAVHHNVGKRIVAWGIASILTFGIFLIPAIVTSVHAHDGNVKLTRLFEEKSLTEKVIAPYGTHQGIIFVPTKQYEKNFSIALTDMHDNKAIVCSTGTLFA